MWNFDVHSIFAWNLHFVKHLLEIDATDIERLKIPTELQVDRRGLSNNLHSDVVQLI